MADSRDWKAGGDEPLKAGMFLSNEPGYYKTGEYGIRVENLVLVVPVEIDGAEKPMLGFETLTFAPIERRLVDVDPRGRRHLVAGLQAIVAGERAAIVEQDSAAGGHHGEKRDAGGDPRQGAHLAGAGLHHFLVARLRTGCSHFTAA